MIIAPILNDNAKYKKSTPKKSNPTSQDPGNKMNDDCDHMKVITVSRSAIVMSASTASA